MNILAAERHFMARNVEYIVKNLSPEDKAVFNCDILDVPMIDYGFLFGYGVHRWIIKEDDIDVPIDLSGHDLNIKFTIAYNRK